MALNSQDPADNLWPGSEIQDNPTPTVSDCLLDPTSSTGSAPYASPSTSVPYHQAYTAAIPKGRRLLESMPTSSAVPSHFTSAAQLRDWGYITTVQTVFPHQADTWALLQLLLPGRTYAAKTLTSVHSTTTTHNGIVSSATNAVLINTIDLTNGVIIAGSNHGPVFTTKDTPLKQGEVLPQFMHWSDIAYLQALSLSDPNRVNHRVRPDAVLPDRHAIAALKYIVRCGIENYSTNLVVHSVIQNYTGEACSYCIADQAFSAGCPHCCAKIAWPGVTFDVGTEEAMALLGTPNGCGVAWMLAQHGEFVGKRVARVRMWSDVTKKPLTPNLLFYVEDVDGEVGG